MFDKDLEEVKEGNGKIVLERRNKELKIKRNNLKKIKDTIKAMNLIEEIDKLELEYFLLEKIA